MFVSVDFETRSQVDLRKTGVYPYAADPSTDIWCMSFSFEGDDAVHTWTPGEDIHPGLRSHIMEGGTLRAWNSGFEYVIWNRILAPRYGWPETGVGQWVDTAAEAAAMALPRGLGKAAAALGMNEEKDDEGYRLMMQMARPRARGAWWLHHDGTHHGPFATKADASAYRKAHGWKPNACTFSQDEDTIIWWDDDLKLARLIDYCEQDVRTEKAMALTLRDLHPAERGVFLMTQRMNDAGVPVDTELVRASQEMLDFALEDATQRLRDLTDDQVLSVTKVNALREWVNANSDLDLDNLRRDTVRDLLNSDLPEGIVREALQIRQDAGKTSTAKLEAFLRCTGDDDRARGLLLYHGASTGRWAGRLIQPQNFPRPEIYDVEPYIDLVKDRDYEALLATGIPVPVLVSSLLRSMFCAPDGRTFMCADYSQVEARVLAWIAGQDDLVDLFRSGGKVYETMGAYIFGKKVEEIGKDSFERQIGKNSILGCFAADTLVLTNRGYVRITDVSPEHKLWDGVEWVGHDGPIYQGEQEVEELWGVQLTPDHLVLTGENWQPALNLVRHASTRYRGLVTGWASLPRSGMRATLRGIFASLRGVRTPGTNGRSRTSKPVYDILNAGLRNRFTILTDRGPLIVHNCGFQMGADRFAEQVREQTGIVLDRGDEEAGRPDLAAQTITGYRTLYSAIPQFWWDIERTAITAVRNPGKAYEVGASPTPIKFLRAGGFLWCQLPSGRRLAYAKPEIRERALPKPYEHVKKEGLSYLGVDGITNQWRRHHTYGGHLTENVVQAMARDLIAGGMLRLQQAGYTPILTVHDEVLVEVDEGVGDFDRFMDLVTTLPRWAAGLPLAGEGWEGRRYRK